ANASRKDASGDDSGKFTVQRFMQHSMQHRSRNETEATITMSPHWRALQYSSDAAVSQVEAGRRPIAPLGRQAQEEVGGDAGVVAPGGVQDGARDQLPQVGAGGAVGGGGHCLGVDIAAEAV